MRPCKRGLKDLMCLTLVIPLVWGISKKKKKKKKKLISFLKIIFLLNNPGKNKFNKNAQCDHAARSRVGAVVAASLDVIPRYV